MPHVIIGHTSSDSVRIWVKGEASSTTCEVTLQPPPHGARHLARAIRLNAARDYTGVVPVEGLEPDTEYAIVATFTPAGAEVHARVRTFKNLTAGTAVPFSFVLSSCNLSIVSINDFLARLSATAGGVFAATSFEIAPYRWLWPKWRFLQRVVRQGGRFAIWGVAKVVKSTTGFKQTGSTYLRSPFLKLAAIFESYVVDLPLPKEPMRSDQESATQREKYAADLEQYRSEMRRLFLAVGDHVASSDGATGIVASVSDDQARTLRRLVITCVYGTFKESAMLSRRVTNGGKKNLSPLTKISSAREGHVWYERPSFFVHAGDQIYYDFPDPDRAPDHKAYRIKYREAWFEDEALQRVLARWPHYMTLDDHEIADQYARDFQPPRPSSSPSQYLLQAGTAYREYADALNPPSNRLGERNGERLWFTFDKGAAHFFVMDTRTRRSNTKRKMIDDEQMRELLRWLCRHRNALKFVVTSVPFVAELNVRTTDEKDDWYGQTRNAEQDKWTAPEFRAQREQVIEHIHRGKIEQLVFLAGDMHCCYHATMRIGKGASRYESTVVHELAAGPVNQLQLGRAADFARHRKARTHGPPKGAVDYEVTLERFHGDVSAVMHLKVHYPANRRIHKDAVDEVVPEVEWNVIRTLTDPGPEGWFRDAPPVPEDQPVTPSQDHPAKRAPVTTEAVMGGRISFARRRKVEGLVSWP